MKLLDMHCDTASRMLYEGEKIYKNNLSVDIEKLKKSNSLAQVFAFFIDIGETDNPYLEFEKMYNNFVEEINNNKKDIDILISKNQLNDNSKIHAILSIEEGEVIKNTSLEDIYNKGIRIITLTWNYKNTFGYPNYEFLYKDKGLTKEGIELVEKMNELGMIIDVSHLSDAGFHDVLKYSKKPFIASHSNSRSIQNHYRNATDDMIRKLSEKGGVIGINFYSKFIGDSKVSRICDMIKHIEHIKNIGGVDVIAIGTDYDGIDSEVQIKDISEMEKLEYALEKHGFTYDEIEKIFYKNAIRTFNTILKE